MSQQTQVDGLAVEDARKRIAADEGERARVADIRSFEGFSEGHIAGAMHVDGQEADAVCQTLEDEEAGSWILVCDTGKSSAKLAAELSERGLDVAYLDGGMEAWVKDKLPTQPPESDKEYEGPDATTLY